MDYTKLKLKNNLLEEDNRSNQNNDSTKENINNTESSVLGGNKLFTLKDKIKEVKPQEKKEVIPRNMFIDENLTKEEKDVFENYNSDFKKNEKSIMMRIKQYKLSKSIKRKPYTYSIGAFIFLFIIGALYFWINSSSFSDLKANLFGEEKKIKIETGSIKEDSIKDPEIKDSFDYAFSGSKFSQETIYSNENPFIKENLTKEEIEEKKAIEQEKLFKEKWLVVKSKVIIFKGGIKKYRYKGKIYSEEEIKKKLKEEIKKEIEERTKKHLKETYNLENTEINTTKNDSLIDENANIDELYNEVIEK